MISLNPAEDGGLGALLVAIIWLIVEWFKHRHKGDETQRQAPR